MHLKVSSLTTPVGHSALKPRYILFNSASVNLVARQRLAKESGLYLGVCSSSYSESEKSRDVPGNHRSNFLFARSNRTVSRLVEHCLGNTCIRNRYNCRDRLRSLIGFRGCGLTKLIQDWCIKKS